MKTEFDRKVEAFKRSLLTEVLAQCTEAQQQTFKKFFTSVNTIREDKIPDAYGLCMRTIRGNHSKGGGE